MPHLPTLYEQLNAARKPERQAIAARVIRGIQGNDPTANADYLGLCEQVIVDMDLIRQDTGQREAWEFSALCSARLLRNTQRLQGFLGAIARAPQAERIIDAGTGSSAVLALAAAVTHPKAEVTGYELNAPAAHCARAIIGLFGFSDRIDIVAADVRTAALPATDLAITETFSAALLGERGVEIAGILAGAAKEVLPAYATLNACDGKMTPHALWQRAAVIDFAFEHTVICGNLCSTGRGQRTVSVHADYYDARGLPILTKQQSYDPLVQPMALGTIDVPRAGTLIGFSYHAGSELSQAPASLWASS